MAARLVSGKKGLAGGKLQSGNLTKRQKDVLTELEKLAKKLGLKVSSGKLLFAGLKLKGGRCSLRDEPWLVLDRFLPYQDQVDTFKKAFLEITPETGIPEIMVQNLDRQGDDAQGPHLRRPLVFGRALLGPAFLGRVLLGRAGVGGAARGCPSARAPFRGGLGALGRHRRGGKARRLKRARGIGGV